MIAVYIVGIIFFSIAFIQVSYLWFQHRSLLTRHRLTLNKINIDLLKYVGNEADNKTYFVKQISQVCYHLSDAYSKGIIKHNDSDNKSKFLKELSLALDGKNVSFNDFYFICKNDLFFLREEPESIVFILNDFFGSKEPISSMLVMKSLTNYQKYKQTFLSKSDHEVFTIV
ncbi:MULTISPECIES: hypothetical protein [Cysteiniphilum]|uniref:hypothetical protein n=1 Tax=Cysteiniphilum TaxID=2056696 RepID=UPI001785AB13|nr:MULTISPECIES: hypothetical protein [Cysteiniphilum]